MFTTFIDKGLPTLLCLCT